MADQIKNGYYPSSGYDEFFNLHLKKDGKILINISHDSGYSAIYDQNFKFIYDIGETPFFLNSGKYILNVNYSSTTYGIMSMYSPQLSSKDDIDSLSPGYYNAETYNHYYHLHIPNDGNVLFNVNHNSGYSAIYDMNLNLVGNIDNKPIFLNAGSYIAHINYSSFNYGTLSFSAPSMVYFDYTMKNDDIIGTYNNDFITGLAGHDVINGRRGDDVLEGQSGDDTLKGGGGDDVLKGGGGRDKILGQRGGDALTSGPGNDKLVGGAGDDLLQGQRGEDKMKGGGGQDVFRFKRGDGKDIILDWADGEDLIQIQKGANKFGNLEIHEKGGNAFVGYGGALDLIKIRNANADQLGPEDFLF